MEKSRSDGLNDLQGRSQGGQRVLQHPPLV